jgi:hypothetical protein
MAPKTARSGSRSGSAKSGSADSGEILARMFKQARVDDANETSMQVDRPAQAAGPPRDSSMRQATAATVPSVVNMNAERTMKSIDADLANMGHAYGKIMLLEKALEEYHAAYNSLRANLKKNGQFIYYPHFKADGAANVIGPLKLGLERLGDFSDRTRSALTTFSDSVQAAVTDTAIPIRERIGKRPPALLSTELIATRRFMAKKEDIPNIIKAYKRTFPTYRFSRYEAERFMSEFHSNIAEIAKYFGKTYITVAFDEKDIYWLIASYLGADEATKLFGEDFVQKYLSKESEIGRDRERFSMN